MSRSHDIIIIGGGHNGLVCASYLARAGHQVLLLEARDLLGGAATSEEIFPGYFAHTGSHYANLLHSKVLDDLNLQSHGLMFQESPVKLFAPQINGSSLTLWQDINRTVENIALLNDKDAAAYPAFVESMQLMSGVLHSSFLKSPPDIIHPDSKDVYNWGGFAFGLKRLGRQQMMEFLRILPMPVFDLLNEWFSHPLLKGALAGSGVSGLDVGPRAAGTAMMSLYQNIGGLLSTRNIIGGMGKLISALEAEAISLGVEIRTASKVNEILTHEQNANSVRGVMLEDGEILRADIVVSNVDPRRTLFDLLGPQYLQPSAMRQVRNIDYRGVTARLDLALDQLPTLNGQTDSEQLQGHIRICPDMDYLERASDDCKYGRFSSHPYLEINIPSLTNQGLAPTGKHLLSIDMQYAPYHLTGSGWQQSRDLLMDRIIDTLEAYAPGIKQQIIHKRLMTPLDLEQQYGLTGGCIHHGRMGLDQMFVLRPIPGRSRYQTPLQGLYLCGAGNHPGGGVSAAPGYNAARAVISKL